MKFKDYLEEVKEMKRPEHYQLIKRGEHYPYEVWGYNDKLGSWQKYVSHDDFDYLNKWAESSNIALPKNPTKKLSRKPPSISEEFEIKKGKKLFGIDKNKWRSLGTIVDIEGDKVKVKSTYI